MTAHQPTYHHLHQKCVCEMCNCGKHACPKPHIKGDYQTSYGKDYLKYDKYLNQSVRQPNNYSPSHYNPNEIVSQYQGQFMARDPVKRSSSVFERNASSIMQSGQFQGQSSYNKAYQKFEGKFGDLRASLLKRQGIELGGQFTGKSHYLSNFRGDASPPSKLAEMKNSVDVGKGIFNADSTYNRNFNGATSEPPKMIIKKDNIDVVSGKFDAHSTYNNNFSGARGMPAEKARSRDNLKPQGVFEGHTTYGQNYLGANGDKSQKVVHKGQFPPNQGKFDSTTTYNTNYQQKDIGPKNFQRPRSRKDLLTSDNKNYSGQTSYNTQYQGTVGDRTQKIVNASLIHLADNKPIQKQSHYTQAYNSKTQPKSIAKQPDNSGVLPVGNFQGNSTYTNHYVETTGVPAGLIKHKDAPMAEGGFVGNTTYGQHYLGTAPPRQSCPVESLNPPTTNHLDQRHMRFNSRLGIWT